MIFYGKVQSGFGFGKRIGFPTVNLVFENNPDLMHGVYAAYASLIHSIGDDTKIRRKKFPALVHYGPRPTIAEEKPSFEVFFLDFPECRNFQELEIEIIGKIRDVMNFDSFEDLAKQKGRDREFAMKTYFS